MNDRYSRQELFTHIGPEGQRKLADKHVLLIGAGALGTGSAEALVRAGVGNITIVDRDYVEWSNLQRQVLYTEEDAEERMPKAIAAKNRLQLVNSKVKIDGIVADVTVQEIESLVKGVNLIIDATDNFETRLLINDISQKQRIPWIYGACVGSYGLTYTIIPDTTPCLHCMLESVPLGGATCDTAGIIAPAVQMVVSYQTAEALKILVEDWNALRSTLISFDLWKNQYTAINLDRIRKQSCLSCGSSPTYPFLDYSNQTKTAVLCGRDTVQIRPAQRIERNLQELERLLSSHGTIKRNAFLLSFTAASHRMVLFADGRVLVHGTKDITEAKRLYHKYLG
ncbi:thiazole biosynthesis adenylyltransferase ThiF [Heyndrickxia acidicola]|uniref:Thiazole biosynthesis adenylyltransferase ThiF n=1 Tax=Heyndrickxia acidicola TaxID=209389 RepID=A0ABU6MGM4_9BACI|nr:thiazole biosynthesis adenylyltransferase ThiF [Heyndrickxia acidicola]MED1203574.1 thiazole biosynthesis adenylyltransferase ThiF [Heyndrickxia acidicola]